MDQFDRSPEDVSFDLDAEEFSLESILDEYKDFQTDAPAPRPQPAYRSRPVTAEMIEEEEAEDAAAEDILMSAELDSALEDITPEAGTDAPDAPPHEDHDVKRYQPKRQRDHATEEEIEKWNETKANAKRLAKKGISGLKHFASKLSEVVPDEPVEPEDAPPAEDAAIPVSADNWGLSFPEEGLTPVGNATADFLSQYDAWYVGDVSQKVIYLTFDCGYENGNTEAILDALKKHSAPAAFFVVGHMIESAPDIVRRMAAEGHIVGNHTYHHYDMSKLSDEAAFSRELTSLEDLYREVTGEQMQKYYRPPQGVYSEENLKMAKSLGYRTVFWSLAYVDWNRDAQPTPEQAYEKLLPRIHPGAVVLLHSTSATNAEILDDLLTKWADMGYRFGTLDELFDAA